MIIIYIIIFFYDLVQSSTTAQLPSSPHPGYTPQLSSPGPVMTSTTIGSVEEVEVRTCRGIRITRLVISIQSIVKLNVLHTLLIMIIK